MNDKKFHFLKRNMKKVFLQFGRGCDYSNYFSGCFCGKNVPTVSVSCNESEIMPYANVIVYKCRIANGRKQYPRWNEIRGYWVDLYLIINGKD